eukprot:CAMPEP_0197625774 /NCGR_PEP_ID=MMETSP1338-20131121/5041_1 /TAXON_ID=43686 ORGANISM="Pelagodinium beii, Strain RCC1491" /NCGR_SAMPLE_ID=MMETSP1338 /ASSEMBLY_ACC=CAM_ASM_000754 /LENGTH=319 /DNA_ID=CAMNT_0043196259 /DNA_START=46 /DNA_END=1005 /DNA_ORIENTATION=-
MAPKAGANVLQEQVVQVTLPDGDVDVRLASLDFAGGQLKLQQLSFSDSGEVQAGGSASVKLASIGDAVAQGSTVKLKSGAGRVLLELEFNGNRTVAQAWAEAIKQPQAVPRQANGHESSAEGNAAEMLQSLIEQQEEQVRLLETIVERKSEQLLQMQQHLEGALEKLQLGQELYGEQQQVVDLQHEKIQRLKAKIEQSPSSTMEQVARAAASACAANAAQAESGARAAAAQRAANKGPQRAGEQPPPPSPAADEEDNDVDDEEEQMLMARLKQLEDEKRNCEEQLRKEQDDIVKQTQALQEMMAALGISGGLEGLSHMK